MALTKAEMAERLFLEVGLNKREAKEFVDAYFEVVREALEKGEQVKLSGFGVAPAAGPPSATGGISGSVMGHLAASGCTRRSPRSRPRRERS